MKIKVEWEMETRGESEIEVDETEVAEWLNNYAEGGSAKPEEVTAQDSSQS